MFKIAAFIRGNRALGHDGYRVAHAGRHMSLSRRLVGMRGYVQSTWIDRPIFEPERAHLTAPRGFNDFWDGCAEVWFDNVDEYFRATKVAPADRAGPRGLERDDAFLEQLFEDGERLCDGAPVQLAVREHVAIPVVRTERSQFKVLQFVRRSATVSADAWERAWIEDYATLYAKAATCQGYVANAQVDLDVISGFFDERMRAVAMSPEGAQLRQRFLAQWHGYASLWFEDVDAFRAFRVLADSALSRLEGELFEALWLVPVDEVIGLMPRRD